MILKLLCIGLVFHSLLLSLMHGTMNLRYLTKLCIRFGSIYEDSERSKNHLSRRGSSKFLLGHIPRTFTIISFDKDVYQVWANICATNRRRDYRLCRRISR
jgi:hypothetical protein